jgi:hypothetical protein
MYAYSRAICVAQALGRVNPTDQTQGCVAATLCHEVSSYVVGLGRKQHLGCTVSRRRRGTRLGAADTVTSTGGSPAPA